MSAIPSKIACTMVREAAKKIVCLVVRLLRGGGVKAGPQREKVPKKRMTTLKLKGEGVC